ncbi:MAG: GAF domain-containing protein [Gallionella sp.]
MNRIQNSEAITNLKLILANDDVRAAVAYLNSLSSQRFTSLYRFNDETLHTLTFFDREHPEIQSSSDIPVLESYCIFVRESGEIFLTHDAQQDERAHNHPKQKMVQSYCGVPLLDQDGKMFGTICHFDFSPGHIADVDVELLEYMAQLLSKSISPVDQSIALNVK